MMLTPETQSIGRPPQEFSPDGEYLIEWAFGYWLGNHEVRSPRVTRARDGVILIDLRDHDWDCWLNWDDPRVLHLGIQTAYRPNAIRFAIDLEMQTVTHVESGSSCSWPGAEPFAIQKVQQMAAGEAGAPMAQSAPTDRPSAHPRTARWMGLALLTLVAALLVWQL